MNIQRIGKKIIPAVFAINTMASGAAYANNIHNYSPIEKVVETSIKSKPVDTKMASFDSALLFMAIGGLCGVGLAKLIRTIKDIRNEKRTSEDNYFGKNFEKESDYLYDYMEQILVGSIASEDYVLSRIDFGENTAQFAKKYPSRKEYIDMFAKTVEDTRLNAVQKEMLGQYLILKATCASEDENTGINHLFPFLSNINDYENMVQEVLTRSVSSGNEDGEDYSQYEDYDKSDEDKPLSDALSKNSKADTNSSKTINLNRVNHDYKFKDVGGQDEAIKMLKQGVLFPIKYPSAFKYDSISHCIILYGPPGTGKTLLAEALANELNANFIKLNGNELTSKWVGESEENWRNLFKEAFKNQPSIILIDEFDGIGAKRGSGDIYNDKTVNQILGLISDVEKTSSQVYVIATTNRLDMIDNALLRPGRFGKQIELKAPASKEDVKQILEIHLGRYPYDTNIDKELLSEQMLAEKMTGAHIALVVHDAYKNAKERNNIFEKMEMNVYKDSDMESVIITQEDLDKVMSDYREKSKKKTPIGFKK